MANNTAAVLARTTFQTSRLLEFFTEKELTMQIGTTREQWPVAILKELIDNSLDACETAGITPEITVTVEADAVSVQDNGPGLPAATLEHSLDYLVRVSDKAYYVSPSRGQLGNALKCVWAAPFVVDGTHGHVEVTTDGVTHAIDVTLDRIAQKLSLEKASASRCVRSAIDRGFLKNLETTRGLPSRLVIGDLLPAEKPILPTAKEDVIALLQGAIRDFLPRPLGQENHADVWECWESLMTWLFEHEKAHFHEICEAEDTLSALEHQGITSGPRYEAACRELLNRFEIARQLKLSKEVKIWAQ